MKVLSAIVLIMWTACFFHCSAEQVAMADGVNACHFSACEAGNSDGSENEGEGQCGLCEFIKFGGVPTVSAFAVDGIVEFTGSVIEEYLPPVRKSDLMAELAWVPAEETDVRPLSKRLCELLAGKSLPARGPNV